MSCGTCQWLLNAGKATPCPQTYGCNTDGSKPVKLKDEKSGRRGKKNSG